MIDYDKYFEVLDAQKNSTYVTYKDALKTYNYLNSAISADFYHPIAIATDGTSFKILSEGEEGWQVIAANAAFVGNCIKIKEFVGPAKRRT